MKERDPDAKEKPLCGSPRQSHVPQRDLPERREAGFPKHWGCKEACHRIPCGVQRILQEAAYGEGAGIQHVLGSEVSLIDQGYAEA